MAADNVNNDIMLGRIARAERETEELKASLASLEAQMGRLGLLADEVFPPEPRLTVVKDETDA
jgi:hypothetical protein